MIARAHDGGQQSGLSLSHRRDYPSKCSIFCFDLWVGHKCHAALSAAVSPPCYYRPVYDNVGLKVDGHIYENVGALRDATPDLILAVKPKVSLEEEQVTGAGPGDVLLSSPLHLLL